MTVFFRFVNLHFFPNPSKLRSFFVISSKNCNVLLCIFSYFDYTDYYFGHTNYSLFSFLQSLYSNFLINLPNFSYCSYALGRHLTASERYSFLTSANFPASTIEAKFGSNGIFAITGIFNSAPTSSALLFPNT